MTRVCVLIRSLTVGGAEKQAALLAHALQRSHDVQVLVLSRAGTSARHVDYLASHGVRTVFLPSGRLRKLAALRGHLARERVQALFCFLPSDSVLGALAARAAGVERIYCGLRNARMKRRKELALRLVHNHVASATISNSHAAARYFAARGFDATRLRVVPNGIELEPEPPPRAPDPVVRVMTAARFVAEKDHAVALEALRLVLDAGVPAEHLRYLVVGSGPLEETIRARARALGLAECVEIVVDPPDLGPLYRRADVYLSTSHFEGLSNSLLEAMNAALPLVATDVGDNAELVRDGENGRLVPVGDAAAIGRALLELVRDPGLRARFGTESRRRLERGYSFEVFQRAYEELLCRDFPEAAEVTGRSACQDRPASVVDDPPG